MKISTGDQEFGDQPTPVVFDSSADGETALRVEIRSMSHASNMNPNVVYKSSGSALNTLSNAPATLTAPTQEAAEIDE